jgi:CBS domain-containing protein
VSFSFPGATIAMAEAMTQFQVSSDQRLSEFEEAYDDEKQIRGAIFSEPLSKVPRRPLVTVPIGATVQQAIQAMNEKHVGCALVVRDGRLAGIFTERDVLTRVVGKAVAMDTPVMRVMTEDPDTLPDSASIAYALHHMSVEGYRHVPLVDALQRPTGVVSVRDIVVWVCELFPASVLNVPPTPETPKTTDGG